MYLTLILLPLIGSISSGFLGRYIGTKGGMILTVTPIIISTLLSILIFFEVGINNMPTLIETFRWLDSEMLNIYWNFSFDSLTVSMLIPVLIVSSLVHIYSIGYMSNDPHNQRFFSYLSLFTFMMIILVTGNNFLVMFVGWEGVGVCSYLLVSFWFTRIAANQSSLSAFLTNRVGDCLLTIGIFVILWTFGNIDYTTVFSLSSYINSNIITIIGICLLIGAMAKSSQIGLHVWLPFAMEGPTPVSALIHAATMVTAGVYLLIRTSPLIEYSNTVLIISLWLGAITSMSSSIIGFFQQDIKKIIAYSTMSQLGMMVIAVGLSSYNLALFHLINHAFYKALLFLGAGSVIHAMYDNQDLRKYGGLKSYLPLTYSVILIASFSLIAIPFMAGFYSKDFILESSYGQYYYSSTVVYFLALIGASFTTLYSIKIIYLTFMSNPNGLLKDYSIAHEGNIFMSLPLIILAIFSIIFGYITKDLFIGIANGFFVDNAIFIHPLHEIVLETEFVVPTKFKILPLIITIFCFISYFLIVEIKTTRINNTLNIISKVNTYKIKIEKKNNELIFILNDNKLNTKISNKIEDKLSNFIEKIIYTNFYYIFVFFNQRLTIELFYNKYISDKILSFGGQTTKVLDKGPIEYIGPYGLEMGLLYISKKISKLDTGIFTTYALYILTGFILYISLWNYIMINELILILLFNVSYIMLKKN